jgi:hypothetical protein
LRQSAAGRYEGEFQATEEGAYLLRVGATGGDSGANLVQTLGLVVPYSPEYRGDATDNGLLVRLARLTEGRVLDFANPKASFEHSIQGVRTTTDLWPLLLLLAIVLLPFDIGVRRVRMTRADIYEWVDEIRRRLGMAPRQPVAVWVGQGKGMPTPEISAMMMAKSRVRDRGRSGNDRQSTTDNGSQLDTPHAPSWVGDLQSGERADKSNRATPIVVPTPEATPTERSGAENDEEESLATKLRRARESR